MRGNDIPTTAARRIRTDHRPTATNEFESRLLSDGVDEAVLEDTQLARLEAARAEVEEAYQTRTDDLDAVDYDAELDGIADSIGTEIQTRIMEVCAEACARVLDRGAEWVDEDWEDVPTVMAAKSEAVAWLRDHPEVCERLWGRRDPQWLIVELRPEATPDV